MTPPSVTNPRLAGSSLASRNREPNPGIRAQLDTWHGAKSLIHKGVQMPNICLHGIYGPLTV